MEQPKNNSDSGDGPRTPEGHASTTMTEFAKETDRTFLAAYIEKTRALYQAHGLSDENFTYVSGKSVEIVYTPSAGQEGHEGITHGGIVAFMIDASAGAFAMTVAKPEEVAVTRGTDITYNQPVLTGKPVYVRSAISPDKNEGTKRQVFIRTEVIQDDSVVVSAETECMIARPEVLARIQATQE